MVIMGLSPPHATCIGTTVNSPALGYSNKTAILRAPGLHTKNIHLLTPRQLPNQGRTVGTPKMCGNSPGSEVLISTIVTFPLHLDSASRSLLQALYPPAMSSQHALATSASACSSPRQLIHQVAAGATHTPFTSCWHAKTTQHTQSTQTLLLHKAIAL